MKNDYVVVLHGILRSSRHTQKLANHIKSKGNHDVLNINYPSTKQPIETLAEIIWEQVQSKLKENKPVHFVGYSMGALIIRVILSQYRPQNLGKVVFLAPPNQGSEFADFFKNNWFYKKLYGPAGQQLLTDQSNIQHLFKPVNYELGIIAGDFSIDPLSFLLIKGKSDGRVSIKSTRLDGMKEHAVLKACHMNFPNNKNVQKQTYHFLKHGVFQKTNAAQIPLKPKISK